MGPRVGHGRRDCPGPPKPGPHTTLSHPTPHMTPTRPWPTPARLPHRPRPSGLSPPEMTPAPPHMPPPRASLACCLAPSLSWTGLLTGASVGSERLCVESRGHGSHSPHTRIAAWSGPGRPGRAAPLPASAKPSFGLQSFRSHPTPTAPRVGLAVGLGVAAPGGADTRLGPQPPLCPWRA